MKWMSFVAALALVVGLAGCKTDPTNKGTVKGTGDKELTITPPAETTVKPGTDDKKIAVKISRTKFDEDVAIAFDNLPDGVSIKETEMKIPKGETSKEFTLVAKADAAEKTGHAVKVTARSGDMSISKEFKVNVKR